MAVLIEAINVVVPNKIIDARHAGGMAGYRTGVPNKTFCTDGSLTRVGFMDPRDVEQFIMQLVQRVGISFPPGDEWVDAAVVDQFQGLALPAPWLHLGRIEGVTAAWLTGEEPGPLAAPAGWTPDSNKSMTLWKPGSGGTVEIHMETGADIDVRKPQYWARAFPDEPPPPGDRRARGREQR